MSKRSSSSSSSSSPNTPIDDLFNRIESIGVCSNRLKQYKKNIVFAFSDGYMVAEVIHLLLSTIIDIKSYMDEGSLSARKSNWERLNKLLSTSRIQMKLSKEEVSAIINRQIQKELVLNFMTLLIDKINDIKRVMISGDTNDTNGNTKGDTSISITSTSNSNSNNNNGMPKSVVRSSIAPTTSISLSVTSQHHLTEIERKKEIGRRTSMMTSQQLDDMYSRAIKVAREESTKRSAMIDEMQKRSETIDSEFRSLRIKNEDELVLIGKRLSVLQLEVKAIEGDCPYMTSQYDDDNVVSASFSSLDVFGFLKVDTNGKGNDNDDEHLY